MNGLFGSEIILPDAEFLLFEFMKQKRSEDAGSLQRQCIVIVSVEERIGCYVFVYWSTTDRSVFAGTYLQLVDHILYGCHIGFFLRLSK